jgi:hypothetical protein
VLQEKAGKKAVLGDDKRPIKISPGATFTRVAKMPNGNPLGVDGVWLKIKVPEREGLEGWIKRINKAEVCDVVPAREEGERARQAQEKEVEKQRKRIEFLDMTRREAAEKSHFLETQLMALGNSRKVDTKAKKQEEMQAENLNKKIEQMEIQKAKMIADKKKLEDDKRRAKKEGEVSSLQAHTLIPIHTNTDYCHVALCLDLHHHRSWSRSSGRTRSRWKSRW